MNRPSHKLNHAHTEGIWSVCWTGKYIFTGAVDDVAKCWTLSSSSPSGENSSSSTLQLEQMYEYPGHVLGIQSVVSDSEGKTLVTSSLDSQIRVWDVETQTLDKTMDAGNGETWTLAYSPVTAHQIVSGSQNGHVNLFDLESEEKRSSWDTKSKFVLSVTYSPDGTQVACGQYDGVVQIFDTETGKELACFEERNAPVRSVTYAPDGKTLFAASDDMHVSVHEVQGNRNIVASLSGHTSWVLDVKCNPSGKQFATCGADRKVKLWDMNKYQCVSTFETHSDQVWSVAYNSEGSQLASVGDDALLQLYEVSQA